MVMHSVALSSTTAATARAAFRGEVTCHGDDDASSATGTTHTAFCNVAVTLKSTWRQKRCWYTPPAAIPPSATTSNHSTTSTPSTANSRPAQAASTAATPSSSATTRGVVNDSLRHAAARSAVTTGFIDTTTAPSTAGAPCASARYRPTNSTP